MVAKAKKTKNKTNARGKNERGWGREIGTRIVRKRNEEVNCFLFLC